MRALFEISGLNIYLQIVVTILSIATTRMITRNNEQKESWIEL